LKNIGASSTIGKKNRRRKDDGLQEGAAMWKDRIVLDPEVLAGKPIVKGTRLAVEFIIDLLAQGWSETDILQNYPALTREDIQACLAYASEALHMQKVFPAQA